MGSWGSWVRAAAVVALCIWSALAQTPVRRFEYKYSFKPPYLAQRDGSIPFWEYGGNAIASSENIRLAPSMRSQKGAVWTKQTVNFQWWEVDIMFRVSGRGRIGADGLAFWYSREKGAYNGEVFGSSDTWVGLGVIMDSFDNDNKHNNPYVMGVVNDGTRKFDHQNDGSTQLLSGCLRDFRNKPFPTRLRVEYYQNTLTVHFHNGMTNDESNYEMCFRSENVILPPNGYFGVSAATGGLADDHDVVHFLSTSLHVPGTQTPSSINQEEQIKLSQEYQDYQKKLEQQKEDYRKEHPDETKDRDSEFEDWFESDAQRELRQIFQGQNAIFDVVKDLHKKVDEVIGKQVNALSVLSSVYSMQQSQGMQPAQAHHGQAPPPPQMGQVPIQRHEVEGVISSQNILINSINELKSYILDISRKADSIIQTQTRAPTAQVQSVGYESQAAINELKDGVNSVKQNIAALGSRLAAQPLNQSCPEVSCVTAGLLGLFFAAQVIVMILYSVYKDRKDSQAKKFY